MCRILLFLPLLLALNSPSHASEPCAATVSALRVMLGDPAFPLTWEETTMRDGKPLLVSILEKNETLFLKFIKTGEGLWAESVGVICKTDADLEIRFTSEQIPVYQRADSLGAGGQLDVARRAGKWRKIYADAARARTVANSDQRMEWDFFTPGKIKL